MFQGPDRAKGSTTPVHNAQSTNKHRMSKGSPSWSKGFDSGADIDREGVVNQGLYCGG